MPKSFEEIRIEALEEALLEYIGRYGISDLAKAAFNVAAPSNTTSTEKLMERLLFEETTRASET